jgi:outer membrane protein assembly factor BamB
VLLRGIAMGQTWIALLLIGALADNPGRASSEGAKTGTPFEIDQNAGRVVRHDAGGQVRWSVSLHRLLGGARASSLLWDAKRVYLRHDNGVTALSATTGVVLWHSEGQTDRLMLSGDLLLATADSGDRWLTGRAVTTGAEVRKLRLPAGAITGLPRGADWVFLGDKGVVRLAPGGKPRWRTPVEGQGWLDDGGLVEVGGDAVAFLYGGIHDSGVQLIRLNAATGKAVWQVQCDPLGVRHSKYRHSVTVTAEGDRLRVTSEASGGTFVEVLDLRTGRQLKRTVSKR